MRSRLAIGAALTVAMYSPISRGDEATTAAADKLFTEGNALAVVGRYDEACPKLAESHRLEPAVGTQFNLADCYEHLGRTATAFSLFTDVAHIARAAGKFERERIAKERASALEPKLGRVRVSVTAPAPGLELKIDDAIISRDKWASPIPLDPGHHRVTATAPSRTGWEGEAESAAGQTSDLVVPELVDPRPPRSDARGSPPRGSSTQRTLAVAVAGAAVVGLAVGGVAGLMSISARSEADKACPEATYHFRCPTVESRDDWNSATTAGNVSTIGFVIGGVALAGAAVLWFTAPSTKVRAGVSPSGLRLEGTF